MGLLVASHVQRPRRPAGKEGRMMPPPPGVTVEPIEILDDDVAEAWPDDPHIPGPRDPERGGSLLLGE